ncbi:hypothetical protein P691DRAFT_805769 [Macrolepiota fuliginosa MF-IS2]|uniref:Uncharacterized protein n=1 Tax=Macrolepiota fuliginosa MF-IS2 TaxID=1400762 RepID=A0A9P5X5Q4_9AGAR|nr:hypothetical protein P691DRAFT_805769 [Macrolepiota fuliginosa MF-IS2]
MTRGSTSNSGSSNSGGGRNTTSSNTNSGGERSDSSYYGVFGGYNRFMLSYGLKPWNHDDVQEAKAILEGFREADREANSRK